MSIARHHTEWLSLVPVSGPFLSLPVLLEAFSAGLEPHDPDHVRLLRQEYDEWRVMGDGGRVIPRDRHNAFIRFILQETLDLPDNLLLQGQSIPQTLQVEIPEHGELLRPDFVLASPPSGNGSPATHHAPRLLIQTYSRSQDLSSYVSGSTWKASPDTRMTELLHGTGVRLGLVTNGEHWMLVDAPKGETSGYASWYASLWLDEPITLRAFRSLLSVQRFFGVPDDQSLESLLAKSASNQQEVTDQLGYQVRKAVEVLIHSLDKADQDFGRELLADVTPEQLYESALTVMMRLVFLFCAEERELIPSKPFPVYEQNYSVCTISRQLRELADQHGEELLERRYDAWQRLLAAFRAVYGGLQHNDIHIPAYGGSLFNPDRFPFLEGRKAGTTWRNSWTGGRGPGSENARNLPDAPPAPRSTPHAPRSTPHATPLPVNNRTVLHLLEALQLLQIKVPGGGPAEARRVSFRALDIEQIGHVYEGLLDHTAKRAVEPYLGLAGTRDKEPEISLAELEREAWGVHREPKSAPQVSFWKWLKEHTGRSESALKKAFSSRPTDHDPRFTSFLRTACQSDDRLWKRVEPLAGLVRMDTFGYPVVIPQGSVFVTSGTDRRSSGTHYTPRSLTEPIVQYTLEPLVYIGPAEGLPKSEWKLKSAKELLALKICDMACGSGAFLVQATRYMAERLLEAWEIERRAGGGERGPLGVDHGPLGETSVEGGCGDDNSELSGSGGLAVSHGSGTGVLSGDKAISEGRTLWDDQSDSAFGCINTSEHRRGAGTGTHQGIPALSEYRSGIADGSPDPSDAGEPSRNTQRTGITAAPSDMRADQPDALASPSVPRTTPLNPPKSPAPRPTDPAARSTPPAPRTPILAPRTTPHASRSTGSPEESLIPEDPTERKLYAMRLIAQRCIYGVDKNPLAVEMAKLSLWLLTMAKDKPFEFLDHSIRSGDSLVGLHSIDQLRHFSLKPDAADAVLFRGPLDEAVDEAIELRLRLEDLPANTVEDVQRQEQLLAEANEKIARLRCAADLLVAAEFWGENAKDKLERVRHAAVVSGHYVEHGPTEEFQNAARRAWENRGPAAEVRAPGSVNREASVDSVSNVSRPTDHASRSTLQPFHWPLEFPEVIVKRGGFDALVGNPPFMGGRMIGRAFGLEYYGFLDHVRDFVVGSPDLCAYFLLRAYSILCNGGAFGLLATKTISETGTRVVCLDQLIERGGTIFRAHSRLGWPGVAAVFVAAVHVLKGQCSSLCVLDDSEVRRINGGLEEAFVDATPLKLKAMKGRYGQGQCLMDNGGYQLNEKDRQALITEDAQSAELIKPLYNGKDLNNLYVFQPYRWVINFRQMTETEARKYRAAFRHVTELVKDYRDGLTGQIHETCYWRFWDYRKKLIEQLEQHERVLASSRHTKYVSFRRVPTDAVYTEATKLYLFFESWEFAVLQSSYHQEWAGWRSATLGETTFAYSTSECLETWPMPDEQNEGIPQCNVIGSRYDAHRESVMAKCRLGLTDLYNRFHDPGESSTDIQHLRDLHVEMDQAVAEAYGWTDLDLCHGFHETKQGLRFTISEPARREVLQRLLKLNHERYAEEVRQGLHGKKGAAGRVASGGKKVTAGGKAATKKPDATESKKGPSLFGEETDE